MKAWLPRVSTCTAVLCVLLHGVTVAYAQTSDSALHAWLAHVHQAARMPAYTGTFVVSANGNMVSAKIWHVCRGSQQIERVDSLSGIPRVIFRRNAEVITFFPQTKVAVAESRASLGLFANLLQSADSDLGSHYQFKSLGSERIAGFDAQRVQLVPQDRLRYGYRVWSEKKSGLVIQLQTLDLDGKVLEQAAFSDLQMAAPLSMDKLARMMDHTDGYRVERPDLLKTTAQAQGWRLNEVVAGFKPTGCFQRPVAALAGASGQGENTMQWIFSDGLATVSLFVEAFDARRHVREGATDMGGATRTLTRHIGAWWVTAVGEAPPVTLHAFAFALERTP